MCNQNPTLLGQIHPHSKYFPLKGYVFPHLMMSIFKWQLLCPFTTSLPTEKPASTAHYEYPEAATPYPRNFLHLKSFSDLFMIYVLSGSSWSLNYLIWFTQFFWVFLGSCNCYTDWCKPACYSICAFNDKQTLNSTFLADYISSCLLFSGILSFSVSSVHSFLFHSITV